MKFASRQLACLDANREARANLRAQYLLTLVALIAAYAVLLDVED